MKRLISAISLLLCLLTAWPSAAQQELQPLPIDPKVRYGHLENGLTYYIRHNELPKERADFYIAQNVGSILEEENQRGLAHFLEHMAFNGSKNFPGHGMDDFIERAGMRNGENFNAYTSFDQTVYMVMNAPVNRPGVADSCLWILHDWSNCLTLSDEEIEKERGVIREEWRSGRDAQTRLWEQQLPKIMPGSRYANRLPIGDIDVIEHFKPDELRAYYRKWYRPDLQAIIVVGDIDVDQTEQQLKKIFADIPAPVNAAERKEEPVPDNAEPLVSIATDKESTRTLLYLFYKHDKLPREVQATVTGLVYNYIQSVASTMMGERFDEILQQANPPFVDAGVYDGDFFMARTKGAWTVVALAKEGEIDSTMTTLVRETERLRQHGFTASEYERARVNVLKSYESAYNERDNQKNRSYMMEYVDHFTNGGSIPGIELEYTLINQIAPAITVEQVNEYIRQILTEQNIVISLTGPEKEGLSYPTEQELLAWFQQARQLPVEPYRETVSDEPLIPVLPAPGSIVKTEQDDRFGATLFTLSNGVRVVVKPTEFKKDQILMTATSPGGTSLFGESDWIHLKVFNQAINLGGWGEFDAVSLNKRLAGKDVSCTPAVGLDDESLNGSAVPADLQTLFELIYLQFTAPRKDSEAFASFETRLKAQLKNQELNPMVAFSDTVTQVVYHNHPRTLRLKEADFERISYDRILEMYRERFADASDFLFTFVGNVNPDSIRPYLEQYLATLPALHRVEKADLTTIARPLPGERISRFLHPMETPMASVLNLLSGRVDDTLESRVTMQMLKQILDLVYFEKVREEEGGTYGVQTSAGISHFPEGDALLQIYFDTEPAKRERMNAIVWAELQRIAEEGPREVDFRKTHDNLLKRHAEQLQENSYWLNTLDVYYYRGYDGLTDYEATVRSVTPEKLRAFTRSLLSQGNRIEVVMEP
ncbi:MAG: M16 family metallopeptidase [Parabacteroides sp.]